MTITNKELKQRIIDISYRHKLSHLGSCLTAVDIIKEIYDKRAPGDPFILSQGHAGLALYVVLEDITNGRLNAEKLFEKHGVHPNRNPEDGIWCSTGSLGQGLPIALGMAFADPTHKVYCQISDGECAEGSIWEALRLKNDLPVKNLEVYVNINGYSAYDSVFSPRLEKRLTAFDPEIKIRHTNSEQLPFLQGVDAHYKVMNQEEYELAMSLLGE